MDGLDHAHVVHVINVLGHNHSLGYGDYVYQVSLKSGQPFLSLVWMVLTMPMLSMVSMSWVITTPWGMGIMCTVPSFIEIGPAIPEFGVDGLDHAHVVHGLDV